MSLYGNKFIETNLNVPVDKKQVDEYINNITKNKKVIFGYDSEETVDILPRELDEDVEKIICKITNDTQPDKLISLEILQQYLNLCIEDFYNNNSINKLFTEHEYCKLKTFEKIFIDNNNLPLQELITEEDNDLIDLCKKVKELIKFGESCENNTQLLNTELDDILTKYIETNIISDSEDDDYINPNLYTAHNLQIYDINYLYNKFVKQPHQLQQDLETNVDDYISSFIINSVVCILSAVSGYIVYTSCLNL